MKPTRSPVASRCQAAQPTTNAPLHAAEAGAAALPGLPGALPGAGTPLAATARSSSALRASRARFSSSSKPRRADRSASCASLAASRSFLRVRNAFCAALQPSPLFSMHCGRATCQLGPAQDSTAKCMQEYWYCQKIILSHLSR